MRFSCFWPFIERLTFIHKIFYDRIRLIKYPDGKQTEKESNSVRLTGKFTSIEDIKNVQVAMPVLGSPVYVKDIADVIDGVKETTSISRYNGKNGIGLMLKKTAAFVFAFM